MNDWTNLKLKKITEFIDGDRGKNYPKQSEYLEDGYCLFLNTSNITPNGFNLDKLNYITKEKYESMRQGKLEYDDLILTTRGTVGNIGHYRRDMFYPMRINSSMLILRVKRKIANPLFIYYLFKTESFKSYMELYSSGSAQPQLPVKDLSEIRMKVPNIQIQDKVASLLDSYDKLIENNNNRIKLLEKTADELYKEWFIRMRFPGYQNTKFEKGIPEGWNVKRIEDIGEVVTGKTPPTSNSEYYGEDIMFVKTPDMHGNMFTMKTKTYLTEKGSNTQPKKLLPKDSIMVSCIGTGGVVLLILSQHIPINKLTLSF